MIREIEKSKLDVSLVKFKKFNKHDHDSSIDSKSSYRYVCRCYVTNEEIHLNKILTIAKIYAETE